MQMSKPPSRRFPLTVTQLPVTRCQICHRTVAYRPGSLSEILTGHYRRARPEALSPLPSNLRRLPHYPPHVPSPAPIPPDALHEPGGKAPAVTGCGYPS